MVRTPDGEMQPLESSLAEVTPQRLMQELSRLVEPERWEALELEGHGEVVVTSPDEPPLKLSLYLTQGHWSVVAYL